MITPDYLNDVMRTTENALSDVSEDIIKRLAARLEQTITKYGEAKLIPTSLNEIYNLEETGYAYADIQKAVEDALPGIQEQVREAFLAGAKKMDEYYGGGVRETYDENSKKPSAPKGEPEEKPKEPPRKEKSKFPDLVEVTGYGNMLGLCGINCRHTMSVCLPNMMDTTPDNIDQRANRKKYALEQQARAMERAIRKKKQLLAAYKGVNEDVVDAEEKKKLVEEINDLILEYQNFCRTNKISMSEWRLATVDSVAPRTRYKSKATLKETPKNMSKNMRKRMENVYQRTNGDIKNMCGTTAAAGQDTFINACDKAFMEIQSGASPTEAIRNAIADVAEQGIQCVYYNSGRKDRIEVALARAIRTGINQANAQLVLMRCAELGIDHVKVSSHYGARVTKKNDYTNHSWWQGKVYHLNWDSKVLSPFKKIRENEIPEEYKKSSNFEENAQEFANNVQKMTKNATLSADNNTQKMAYNESVEWGAKQEKINREDSKEINNYARSHNIELIGAKEYDGDIETIKSVIDVANKVTKDFPEITRGKRRLTIQIDYNLSDDDFAITHGHIIHINGHAYRNITKLEEVYKKRMENGWFVENTDYNSIIVHELGHVIANLYRVDSMEISKKLLNKKEKAVINYVFSNLSEYAGDYENGQEIISECFSAYYSGNTTDFVIKFIQEVMNIIKKE